MNLTSGRACRVGGCRSWAVLLCLGLAACGLGCQRTTTTTEPRFSGHDVRHLGDPSSFLSTPEVNRVRANRDGAVLKIVDLMEWKDGSVYVGVATASSAATKATYDYMTYALMQEVGFLAERRSDHSTFTLSPSPVPKGDHEGFVSYNMVGFPWATSSDTRLNVDWFRFTPSQPLAANESVLILWQRPVQVVEGVDLIDGDVIVRASGL